MIHPAGAGASGRFLCLTALEEFRDPSLARVLLAQWCAVPGSVASGTAEILPCPWADSGELERACAYIDETFDWILPRLGERLNAIHGTSHGDRYWMILAGMWLVWYVTLLYDRYRRLRHALDLYPGIPSLGMAPECRIVPDDTLAFNELAKGDFYNHQIMTVLLELMGHPPACRAASAIPTPPRPPGPPSGRPGRKAAAAAFHAALGAHQRFSPVIFKSSYFADMREDVRMVARTLGRAAVNRAPYSDMGGIGVSPDLRARLAGLADGGEADPFRTLLSDSIPGDLPKCFLEGYSRLVETGRRQYPDPPRAIFTANSYYFDEPFKHWAGSCAERGTYFAGAQHGGNYGCFHHMPTHEHEMRIVDRFYSWGWSIEGMEDKVKPFVATKLCGRSPQPADNRKEGVLFVTSATPRYLCNLLYSEYHWSAYIDWQVRFLQAAARGADKRLRARPHREDDGWDYVGRWRKAVPDIRVETWDVPFVKSLEDCRIYVSDHLETTFIEALSAGKPSILFWNPGHRRMRKEAAPYFARLREAGILHETPESAAAALEEAYVDIEAWWNRPFRQEARKAFCERFGLARPDGYRRWARELRDLAHAGRGRDGR